MEYFKDDFDWSSKCKAKKPLRIIIVGAGIAGLSAALGLKQSGHDVAIYEQVKEIAEVGAGIQMAPNNTRILGRFGVLEEVSKNMNILERNSLRRWDDDSELGTAPLMPKIGEKYRAPLGVIHRGDLQRILLQSVKDAGIPIHTSSHVVSAAEDFSPTIHLSSGETVSGDLVIAADGIKSTIRGQIAKSHNHVDKSSPTGDSAYRILIPRGKLEHDERALKLLEQNVGMRWMGPGGHVMAYPIKNNQVYNMVLLHPQKADQDDEESWTKKGDKKEMMSFYGKWNSLLQDLLSYVPDGEVLEWTLNSHAPLPSWHQNKVVLIGDAVHPMLPYVAQGAAQAIEDAGVITAALTQTDDVELAIDVYEQVRKHRGEVVQSSAGQVRKALHLPDGPEQRARDEKIQAAGQGKGDNPDLWADTTFQEFMWGTDVMKQVVEDWEALESKARGHHLHDVAAVGY